MRTLNFKFCSNAQEEMYRNSAFHQQVRQTVHSYKLWEGCEGAWGIVTDHHPSPAHKKSASLRGFLISDCAGRPAPRRGVARRQQSNTVHELHCFADENVIGREEVQRVQSLSA